MNIFVSNISFKVREQSLSELFDQFGEVVSVRIIKDKETRRSKGYGLKMYKALLDLTPYDGFCAYQPQRHNKKEVPKIYKRLGYRIVGDYWIVDKQANVNENIIIDNIIYDIIPLKDNIKIVAYKNSKTQLNYLGEIKTTKQEIDYKLNTISISEIYVNNSNKNQEIGVLLYNKLLSILPNNIKGIRMSDIINSPYIGKIYDKLNAVRIGNQIIIKNNKSIL
jgi:L-amino acid N-acyltransferase YncA